MGMEGDFMPKNQKKEKKSSKITRRKVLKMGAIAGGVTILTSNKAFKTHFLDGEVYAQQEAFPPVPPEPVVCDGDFETSPATRPFRQQLPIPPALQPTTLNPAPTRTANIARGEAPRAAHQRWNEFLPQKQYSLRARPALVRFHPDLPQTYVWAFNGLVQGPTILAKYNEPALVRFFNDLPSNHTGFGLEEITIHMHNGHTPSESDGFAGDYFGPRLWKDNHYPNILAGYDAFPSTKGDPREAQYSYWYHDHRAMFTAGNTYRGLAGMYLMFDKKDSGNENDTTAGALRLPSGYGVHDIPLEFSDKLFCPDGQLFADPDGVVFPGDKWCVNGAIQPFLPVKRRKYRFRLLNTGPTRTWIHKLSTNWPLTVIATDGNLLRNPIQVDTITHSVAERYDVIIDFSRARVGDKVYLLNVNEDEDPQFVGFPSPTPLPPGVTIEQVVMRFDVVGNEADPSQVPATLTQYPNINVPIAAVKEWNFTRAPEDDPVAPNQFQVNGLPFDAARSDHRVEQGTAEIWILRNLVPESNWTHPVHIHFEEFRVLQRNGAAPPPLETGRKDVIRLPPGNEVRLFMQFRDFLGRYLIHCHNMNHEDNFMMVRWDIVNHHAAASGKKEVVG
jgi:FtsP/CotA-like multicopper oxidase with cupredoxin domain